MEGTAEASTAVVADFMAEEAEDSMVAVAEEGTASLSFPLRIC
jgi:hypothetical protein